MGLLSGKFAIVTGAASPRGLGKATAKLFAEHGATVAITDLDEAQAQAAAADLPGEGHVGMACNVTDKDACFAVAKALVEKFGAVDILVNNAGITQPLKIMEIAPENYDAVTDVNLRGTLYMTQALIPHWRERQTGSVVNMSSVSAQRGGGIFGGPHYSAAKAGVLGLTKAMARELAPDGVRVNAICPASSPPTSPPASSPTRCARRFWPASRWAAPAPPTTWRAAPCSWPRSSRATAPAPRST